MTRSLAFSLLFISSGLAACDSMAPAVPRPQPDAPIAADAGVVVDAPRDARARTCDEGTIVLHESADVVSLASNGERWAVTYQDADEAYLRLLDATGHLLGAPISVPRGTRVVAFDGGFLTLGRSAHGTLQRIASDGDVLGLVPSSEIDPLEEVAHAAAVDGATVLFVTTHAAGRSVYRVTRDGVARVLDLPTAAHFAVGLSWSAVLDLTIEDDWDGRPDLRLYTLSDRGLTEERLAWEDGPQSLAAVHYQDGVWQILGGRRDPESRFFRGALTTLTREPSAPIVFGAPPELSLEDGAYYGVAGALTGDEPLGLVLEGSVGVLLGDHLVRSPHGLDSVHPEGGSLPVQPLVIAFNASSQRFGVVGHVGDALVLRCDLRADGTHAAFDPRAL